MNNTLKELRQACKQAGIQVKKQTLSHGIHLKFLHNGISSGAVNFDSDTFTVLKDIKASFQGLKIDGQKVYGLK